MSFFLRARRKMACGFVFALALSGPVLAASPAIPISYTEALQRALANAPTLHVRRSQIDASTEEAARAGALPDPRLIVGLANWPVSGPDAFSLRADEMTTQQIGLMQEFVDRYPQLRLSSLPSFGSAVIPEMHIEFGFSGQPALVAIALAEWKKALQARGYALCDRPVAA